ncbi:MAG: ferritin-like domain-containing protein, partial [Acidimicrobiia bacterium]|nr:ferritin-like domain-containing protein [Acidimicrobiia bacterium]
MTSTEHRSDAAILGRASVNDVDTILDICRSNAHSTEVEHIVPDASDALFTWDYDKGARPKLEKLYEKGKT